MRHVWAWLLAARLHTVPLSLSIVAVASGLAYRAGAFDLLLMFLLATTLVCLQILSNFANDLGDSLHGIDHPGRQGPSRAVQTGRITPAAMRRAAAVVAVCAFVVGVLLLWYAFYGAWVWFFGFLILGLGALWAAVAYTYGQRPYGHAGWGDVAVFVFFGILGVAGSYFLYTHTLHASVWSIAYAFGACAVAVLHLNNWRDRQADAQANKRSVAVRLGPVGSMWYYRMLLLSALGSVALHTFWTQGSWMWLIVTPLWAYMLLGVQTHSTPAALNTHLRYMVGLTVLWAFVLVWQWVMY